MGETKIRCPNINKMKKIGYYPKTSLDDGLKKTVKWYLNNF
jgi:nucleoside-diphosphate-sugar epimerase